MDTRTGRELGRYWVGESPSRTAVDLNGNVWVGNRGDGTATHIFGDTRDCVDRNGDGVIQTSRDLNGDGVITGAELLPEAFENALADECVNCQIRVGTATDLVRGVGVDADNYGWLGTYNSQELFRVDPLTCEIVAQFSTAGPNSGERSRPIYGLAITPDGELFTSSFGSACNARVSIEEERVIEHVCSPGTTYGMAVGPDGRVWYGGAGAQIYVYDPAERTWTELTPPEGGLRYAAGMVVDNDGVVYIADHSSSAIVKYDPATSVWEFFYANTPPSGLTVQTGIRGVTIDAEGHIWGFALSSSGLVEMNTDGDWIGSYDVVSASNPSNGVGVYSYSDNTGFQLFNIVAREGRWSNLIDVGAAVRFLELEIISFEPESTSVETEVRWGNSVEEVNDAEWVVAGTSGIVSLRELVPDATRYLEVRVTMRTSDPLQRPVVRDVQVRYETVDCRLAGGRCPSSQICDPVYGGCLVPPPSCFQDNQCGFDQYCDATGSCRFGCRQNGGSCALGEVCDTEERVCVSNSVDCNDNANCEDGSYCDGSGVCIAGCRLTENDCPRGFTCDADARTCEPVAPECATDAECGDGDYCQGSECVPGCRLAGGTCGEEEVCDAISRACLPAPPACDPEAISEEICNGLDDDCDGEIDNAPTDVGVTCMAGDRLTGETVCMNAALLCRADPATTEAGETIAQYASVAIDDSQTSGRAINITGPPEATRCAALADSWQGPTDDTEGFFHVGFDVAVRPTELRVYNNRYPGGVTRIDVVTTDGVRLEDVWSGVDDTECAAALTIDLSAIDEPIDEVIVYSMIENREEYDAVELVGASVSPTPPRLAGALDNVLLPAAEYRVIGELLSVVDRSFMEPGVSFTSPLGEWELARSGEGDSQWTGVAFHNTSVNWRGTGAHLIEDSVFTADVATDFDTRAMPLRVLGADFRNVQLDSSTSANALIADSRFVADVSVPALLTLNGGGAVRDSEIIGENRLPRRGTGLVLGGTTPIAASGVSISKLDIGIRLTSGSGTGHLISDSVVQDADEGVYITSGRAEFRNVLFDYTDLGHQGIGIREGLLTSAQGIDLYDVTFDLGIGDRGLVTDVSRFNEASPTVWENLTFLGGSPERFVGLAGSTDTGNVTIEPTAGIDTFFLYGNTTIASDAILNIEDVSIVTSAANGYQYMRASARSATTVRNTSFRNTALYSTAAGPTLDIADSNFVYTYDSVSRSMIEWSGVLTGARLAFTSIADAGLSTRLHTGVYIINEGEATLTDLTLTGLRYGLSSGDNTVLTATDVVARDCTYGLRPFEQTVMTINDFTFIDESELLDSIGMDSDLQVGGQFSIVNASFSGDAADRAIEMDYDSFATGSESTVTGDVSFDGEIVPVVLNGDWTDTDMPLVIRPVVEDTPILLPGNVSWTRDDGIVLDGSVRLAAFPNTARSITVGAASSLTMMPGTSLENLRVANSGTMTAEGVEFFADRITSELLDNLGTLSCTGCLFRSVERMANGLRTESGGEATLVNSRFENVFHATITNQSSSSISSTGSVFDDVTTAIWTGGLVDVSFDDTTIIGGEEQTTGLLNTSPLDGLTLELVDTSFELSEDDRPFYLDIEVLRDTNLPSRSPAPALSAARWGWGTSSPMSCAAARLT